MTKLLFLAILFILNTCVYGQFYLPIACHDRKDISSIQLTEIGTFGHIREERPNVPEHLHTGIDIKRPFNNYMDEPIFPITEGTVISIRDDGPYAQIIVYHNHNGVVFWTVYEHVAGINCEVGMRVFPEEPIARFMNKTELNKYGWQFNHFHLEIMQTPPIENKPTPKLPNRFYTTYWLSCFTKDQLNRHYYNPINMLTDLL